MNIDKLKELKSKATPGPWWSQSDWIFSGGNRIASTCSKAVDKETQIANAQLICEAVNNLDALLEVVGWAQNVCFLAKDQKLEDHVENNIDNMREALAKLEE